MTNHLKIQQLITIGVYSAIYFLGVGVSQVISLFLLPGFSYIFTPAITALITGIIFILTCHRIQSFGAIFTMGIMMALFFALSGHFIVAAIPCLIFSFLADWIAAKGNYVNKKYNTFSFTIFAFHLTGPILPLWFMKDMYISSLLNRGKDVAYIERIFAPINTYTFVSSMSATIICGILGALIGYKLYDKHFKKQRDHYDVRAN